MTPCRQTAKQVHPCVCQPHTPRAPHVACPKSATYVSYDVFLTPCVTRCDDISLVSCVMPYTSGSTSHTIYPWPRVSEISLALGVTCYISDLVCYKYLYISPCESHDIVCHRYIPLPKGSPDISLGDVPERHLRPGGHDISLPSRVADIYSRAMSHTIFL